MMELRLVWFKMQLLIFFVIFLFVACSDSGTDSGIAQAETVYGLGECERSNEGVTKLVTSEDQYYKCVDGAWEETEAPVQSSSSKVFPFAGSGTLKDPRDGQTYRTVKIGDQVWMAENLNYRYLGPTADEDSSSFCYDNNPANCTKYGRLYLWNAAIDSAGIIKGNKATCRGDVNYCVPSEPVRGVCPQGWHLPSKAEFETLIDAVGGEDVAGKMLKSTSGWLDYDGKNGNGDDAFGFSALPAGYRNYNGFYYGEGGYAYFWSSTERNSSNGAYYMYLNYGVDFADLNYGYKNVGFSVRCLKD